MKNPQESGQTQFGIDGREILAIAHHLLTPSGNDGCLFVRQIQGEYFIHGINEQNDRARLAVRWDVFHGWVFTDMGTPRRQRNQQCDGNQTGGKTESA